MDEDKPETQHLRYTEIKGDVIYEGERHIHSIGGSEAATLAFFKRFVKGGERILKAKVILEKDGTFNWVFRLRYEEEK